MQLSKRVQRNSGDLANAGAPTRMGKGKGDAAAEANSRDGFFIRVGRFEAGAYGRIGVVVLAVALIALLVGRGMGAW